MNVRVRPMFLKLNLGRISGKVLDIRDCFRPVKRRVVGVEPFILFAHLALEHPLLVEVIVVDGRAKHT